MAKEGVKSVGRQEERGERRRRGAEREGKQESGGRREGRRTGAGRSAVEAIVEVEDGRRG
jgi:hypothetical protein